MNLMHMDGQAGEGREAPNLRAIHDQVLLGDASANDELAQVLLPWLRHELFTEFSHTDAELISDAAIRITRLDGVSGSSRIIYEADWTGTNALPGLLRLKEVDQDGVEMDYTYDGMRRLKTMSRKGCAAAGGFAAQSDIVTSYAYDAFGRQTASVKSSSGLNVTNRTFFDLAGRLSSEIKPDGTLYTNVFTDGGRTITTTLSGGATKVVSKYLSRNLKSITGSSVIAEYYDYGRTDSAAPEGFPESYDWTTDAMYQVKTVGVQAGPRTVRTVFSFVGFHTRDEIPGNTSPLTNWFDFDQLDRVSSISTPGSVPGILNTTYLGLDLSQRTNAQWLYVGGSNWAPKRDSLDRLSSVDVSYDKIGSDWFRTTTSRSYLIDSDATPARSIMRERLTGFNSTTKAEITSVDVSTNSTVQTVTVDRTGKKLTAVTVTDQSSLAATSVSVNGLLQSESTLTVAGPKLHFYDGLQRETKVVSPAGASWTTTYDPPTGRVTAKTDFAGNTTSYAYYANTHTNAGLLSTITAANGKKTYFSYNWRGQLLKTWGDVPYPEERVYNDYGEVTQLKTYRGGTGWNASSWPGSPGTADVTTWNYQEATGLLLSKTDALNHSVSYAYWTNNLLATRTWSRGVVTTNLYNSLGDLERLDYSDGTPSVLYTNYNRAGIPRLILDGSGSHTLTYDYASRLVSDSCTSGDFNGITVTNHFNPLYGRDSVQLQISGQSTIEDDYGYDAFGRVNSASSGGYSASYGYLANSDRLQGTTNKNNGSNVLTTIRTWQSGERVQSIVNLAGQAAMSMHNYLYDAANRRSQATLADGSIWQYAYDDRDELVSARHYWADWSPVTGQQFQYGFDNLGNRTTGKSGGDALGSNLRSSTLGQNAINQYTNITTPGYKDIIGAATATNSVTVNGGSTDRKGEYYHNELPISNGAGPVYQSVTVSCGSSNLGGDLLFPPNQQIATWDSDGNISSDGLMNYTWDAENRLITVESSSAVTNNTKRKLIFTYDNQGRRTRKRVYLWATSDWNTAPALDQRFVYDQWNLLAEINTTNNVPIRSYLWGLDLSATMAGVGGIGGLISVKDHSAGTRHFAAYDANGNLTALVNASDQSLSAQYEYSPFGEAIRLTGPMGKSNPIRFSTRISDDESGLTIFPKRFYNPATGRWISRDSSGENDGNNLYAFLANRPLDLVDPDGAGKWWDRIVSVIMLGGRLLSDPGPDGTKPPVIVRTPMSERVLQSSELEKRRQGRTAKSGAAGSSGGKGAGIQNS